MGTGLETGLNQAPWVCKPLRPGGLQREAMGTLRAAPTFTPALDLDLAVSLVSFSFRGGGLLPGQSPHTFCSQPHQKHGLWDSGTPNPTRPGLSKKKHENVLSRVGVDFYNSTTCLIVGTSPTTSMCQLQRDREHVRIPCTPAWGG